MRYISLFSGIEAATVAWEPLGWEPIAFCEVDEFPSAVLAHRFPNVPNLGDITKVDWSDYVGAVDLIVGGSPCQSFSVAGKREGLQGESGLMFEYIRAVREVRPRWFVWENVPGALSSEKGAAFHQLLSEMAELGYGLAWRVLDAQFFGVAQRRRRVFLVGNLGNGGGAAEVLFEPESLCWDYPSSREKREELTRAARQHSAEDRGERCLTFDTTQITSPANGSKPQFGDPCHCLPAAGHPPTIVIDRAAFNQGVNAQYEPHIEESDVMDTLVARGPHAVCMASGQANAEIEYDMTPAQVARQYKDPQIVCYAKESGQ